MASLYRKSDRKPIPAGAELVVRKQGRYARWVDGRGRIQTAPLSGDGASILRERPNWYFDFQGESGWVKGVRGNRDKEATESLARRMERDAARARMGLAPSADPVLALTHIDQALARWLASLRHDNADDAYVANMDRLLRKVAAGCGWTTLASIRPDRVRAWLEDIKAHGVADASGRRKQRLPSDRTVDQYLEVAKRFVTWCCSLSPPYLVDNPLSALKKIQKPIRVRRRRALSEADLRRLAEVAGPRSLIYRLAALTGLRKDEIRQLQWRDARIDQTKPMILLRAEANKARREDRIPLNREAAAVLEQLRPQEYHPLAPVFDKVPTLDTLKRDLRRAGIPYRDAEGRQFDFHSFRYCFCTLLARANVPIRAAIELMRHRDPKLTIQIYTDSGQLELDEAVSRLPSLST